MKEKKILVILICIFSLGIFACNNNDNDKEMEEVKQKEIYIPDITISQNEYEDLWYISQNKILIKKENKYGVIDYDENVLIDAEYDYGINFISENKFMLGNYYEDGYECYLYDDEINIVFSNEKYPEFTIAYVNDGVMVLTNKTLNEYIYLDINNEYKEMFRLNENTVPGFMLATAFDNGYTLVVSDKYTKDGYQNLYDKDGNVRRLKHNDNIIYTYYGCAIGEDGWIICYEIDLDDANKNKKGFYNIISNIFIDMPDNLQHITPIKDDKGILHASNSNYALVKENINTNDVYIFDIKNKRIINKEAYSYVELNSKRKKLFSKNNKWGYLDNEYKEGNIYYEDATSYSNQGYALINKNGNEYLINENEEIVSEAMVGIEATQENDLFVIKNGDKKYFIQIR